MTTVDQLIDQVSAMLHSYTGSLEATTALTSGIDADDTAIPVEHPAYITRGLIEVGNELMHVSAVGDTSVTLYPFGRGTQNTTATSHLSGARVTNDPLFPRQRIFDALKRCIHNVQLDLYGVGTTEFTFSTVQTTYELPADTVRVLAVQYEIVGPSREWATIMNWSLDHNADTATGKALVIQESVQAGRAVQVTYAKELPVPSVSSTDLETSGVPAWMHPVLMYGTAWEMVQFTEPARLQLKAVEARTQASGVEVGAASNLAKQLYAMYQLRLDSARKRLLTTHPSPKHYVRY